MNETTQLIETLQDVQETMKQITNDLRNDRIEPIKTVDDVVVCMDGILARKKTKMMNLSSKSFEELDKNELQREIDYLWGQYDYISWNENLPQEMKFNDSNRVWAEIDRCTTRYICKSLEKVTSIK